MFCESGTFCFAVYRTFNFYQITGTVGEWIYIGSFYSAIQDFRIGIPGMCLQVFGGYLFIKCLICS